MTLTERSTRKAIGQAHKLLDALHTAHKLRSNKTATKEQIFQARTKVFWALHNIAVTLNHNDPVINANAGTEAVNPDF